MRTPQSTVYDFIEKCLILTFNERDLLNGTQIPPVYSVENWIPHTNLWKLNFQSIHLHRILIHIFHVICGKLNSKYFIESQLPVEFGLPGLDEFSPRLNHETFRGWFSKTVTWPNRPQEQLAWHVTSTWSTRLCIAKVFTLKPLCKDLLSI